MSFLKLKSDDKILVTGATGLLGQHIVKQLLDRNKGVRVLVRNINDRNLFAPKVEVFVGDIRRALEVQKAVTGCRFVFHCCCTHVYNLPYKEVLATNVDGTRNICDAVEKNDCEKLVFTSTISTFRCDVSQSKALSKMPPRKLITLSKKLAEELILARIQKGLQAVILNPVFFIGPFDYKPCPFRLLVPLALIKQIRFVPKGGFNVIGAADVAAAHLWALADGEIGKRYPVIGQNIRLSEYVAMIHQAMGRPRLPKEIPGRVLGWLARGRVFDAYVARMLNSLNFVEKSNGMLKERQPLESAVEETVNWFSKYSSLTTIRTFLHYIYKRYI